MSVVSAWSILRRSPALPTGVPCVTNWPFAISEVCARRPVGKIRPESPAMELCSRRATYDEGLLGAEQQAAVSGFVDWLLNRRLVGRTFRTWQLSLHAEHSLRCLPSAPHRPFWRTHDSISSWLEHDMIAE